MSDKDLPAFPVLGEGGSWHAADGMTMRDYFAAKAMQGNIAASESGGYIDLKIAARWAYEMADAMMKAREIKNG